MSVIGASDRPARLSLYIAHLFSSTPPYDPPVSAPTSLSSFALFENVSGRFNKSD